MARQYVDRRAHSGGQALSWIGLRRSGAAALLLALTACASTTSDSPPSTSPPTPAPQSLADALTAARLETGAPGATAAIVRDGALVFVGASGEATRSPSSPIATTSLLSFAGATEMATAAIVLRLREEGRLSLEDPLARYVSYVPGADRITVGMLLAHRAGLPDYQGLSFDELYISFQDPTHVWTRGEILRAIDPEDDLRAPGQGYRYSATDYVALGVVVEQASGMGVDALFERLIAAPLGLERCLFGPNPALAPGWPRASPTMAPGVSTSRSSRPTAASRHTCGDRSGPTAGSCAPRRTRPVSRTRSSAAAS